MPKSTIPAELKSIIDGHMRLFNGWTMTAGPAEQTAEQGAASEAAKSDGEKAKAGDGDGKPLGPNGEKALHSEREARKEADRKVAALESQMSRLAQALGVQSDDTTSKDADQVAALTGKVDELLQTVAVTQIAADHGITDKDDLALLREQPTEDAMRRLAARIKPATGDGSKPNTPKPDPSTGRGGGTDSKTTGVSAGRDLFKSTHTSSKTS